ncbi:hypothetical protein [Actinomadura napierensis]|uniref:Uncharacterized protein n=1 Tax=Actinomadura napierensis TaxID=267854 RepID=A0ABN3A219_9ACTN
MSLRQFIDRVEQREDAVSAVLEGVAPPVLDARGRHGPLHLAVDLATQFLLDRVRAERPGRVLQVDGQNAPVHRVAAHLAAPKFALLLEPLAIVCNRFSDSCKMHSDMHRSRIVSVSIWQG